MDDTDNQVDEQNVSGTETDWANARLAASAGAIGFHPLASQSGSLAFGGITAMYVQNTQSPLSLCNLPIVRDSQLCR